MYKYDDNDNSNENPEEIGDASDPGNETGRDMSAGNDGGKAHSESGGDEYHYVRPDESRSAWRDAGYTPQSETTVPPRYYIPEDKPPKEKKPREKGRMTFAKVAALCLVCALLGGLAGGAVTGRYLAAGGTSEPAAQTTPVLSPATSSPATAATDISSDSVTASSIYSMGCEQTVGISTEITSENIFGMPVSGSVSGSGFVITDDGYIMTNFHVIEDAYQGGYDVTVMLHDGTPYKATIVGFDKDNDIAVLKIDATGLNPVTIGNSDSISVGNTVYAIGNPLGELDYTMTSGIISATDRVITTDESTSINMFQFDAAVNSGNSGGPLYNSDGQVVGVVTAKYSSTGVEGLGFAIPINDAVGIANDIIQNGYVTGKPYMGVVVQTVSASVAQYYNMVQGAYVYSLTSGGAAEAAGLKVGDIITDLDGTAITSADDLTAAVKSHKAGDTVSLTVWRSGDTLYLTVTFGEETPETEAANKADESQTNTPQGYPYSSGW